MLIILALHCLHTLKRSSSLWPYIWPRNSILVFLLLLKLCSQSLCQLFLEVAVNISKVLVLKLKHIDLIYRHVEAFLIICDFQHCVCLVISLLYQLLVFGQTLWDHLFDVNISAKVDHISLSSHNLLCTMQDDLFVLGLVKRERLVYLAALLDEHLIDFEPDGLSLHNLLLNCVFGHQAVDIDFLFLANSVRSIHSL